MMKIRYALLLSVSCLGFGSTALAGLNLDKSSVESNIFIFTWRENRSSYTHLASQSKLLSSNRYGLGQVIEGQTASMHYDTDDLLILSEAQGVRSGALFLTNYQQSTGLNRSRLASVCFITDAGNCGGDDFGGANSPDNSSDGTPGGSSSGGNNDDDWTLDNKERCNKEGYIKNSCSSVQNPINHCPYDSTYFERCECKPNLVTCVKPYYGVGESCDGKYASCKLDNDRACKEDGYIQTGYCSSVQNINKKCPYDANYFDKCVCRSDLYTCSSPLQGVGEVCGGKYANCQCPGSYRSCSCGAAVGASSCSWGGTTRYSSCKSCNSSSSSSSSSSSGAPFVCANEPYINSDGKTCVAKKEWVLIPGTKGSYRCEIVSIYC